MIRQANFSPKIKGFNSALKASRFCTLKSHYPSDVQYMGTVDKLKFTTGFVISYLTLACENSRPSSLPARMAFRVKDVCDLPPKIPY